MEFHEKLQELRKQRGLTQEELAQALYVTRTAVSKWESGRGFPNIDSLKQISAYFAVSVDVLLSGDQLLTIATEDTRQKTARVRTWVFGLLDVSVLMYLYLPWFGQTVDGVLQEVSLLSLTAVAPYMRVAYLIGVLTLALMGGLTLLLQHTHFRFWEKLQAPLSVVLGGAGALLFVFGSQPYAAAFLLISLLIKVLLLLKCR